MSIQVQETRDSYENHDLIPGNDGDLVFTIPVYKLEKLIIAAHSDDSNNFSISLVWEDLNQNHTFLTESASDIGISATAEGYAELVPKGEQVTVTVTDTSGAANNRVNVRVHGVPMLDI